MLRLLGFLLVIGLLGLTACAQQEQLPPPEREALLPERPVEPGPPERRFPGIQVNPYNPNEMTPVAQEEPAPDGSVRMWRDNPAPK